MKGNADINRFQPVEYSICGSGDSQCGCALEYVHFAHLIGDSTDDLAGCRTRADDANALTF